MPLHILKPANETDALERIIGHDIEVIDDLEEFLADDMEDCLEAMLGNAGCFY